jgi:hypothetical protein
MLHRAFHLVFFIAFMGTLGAAFIGLVVPLLWPERNALPLPPIWVLLALAFAAGAALGADWLIHSL